MKIEGSHSVSAPPDRVFAVLTDPECLKRIMPGCEEIDETGENAYKIAMRAGVGPIKGLYEGSVRLEDVRAPVHYRLIVDARGKQGHVTGEGDVDLDEEGEATKVTYRGEVALGGPVASVGQRLHKSAARMITRQLFGAIQAEAQAEEGETVKHGIIRDTLRGMRRTRRS